MTDLFDAKPLRELTGDSSAITIEISDSASSTVSDERLSEVVAIQRLITLSNSHAELIFEWDERVAQRVFAAPALFPILSVSLCLDNSVHKIHDSSKRAFVDGNIKAKAARSRALAYRLKIDAFMDCQVLLCADSLGKGFHADLYTRDRMLNDTEGMEALVEDLLVHHLSTGTEQSTSYRLREALGVIVSELFENTELHGKKDIDGSPIARNSLRGLIIKRIQRQARVKPGPSKNREVSLEYLELSIFDSGIGFYSSFKKAPMSPTVTLDDEWQVMHYCLQRHHNIKLSDSRLEHRGMGLYEVLRALMSAKGFIEIRSGRTFAYRTFLEGDMRMQLESQSSDTRPGMPKPVLLDATRIFVTVPTEHECLTGSAVRVLFPLK